MGAHFEENAVYTRDELQQMLGGAVSTEVFLEKLHIPTRFKHLVLGADILRAIRSLPTDEAGEVPEPVIRTGKRGRPRKHPLAPITIHELTGRAKQ